MRFKTLLAASVLCGSMASAYAADSLDFSKQTYTEKSVTVNGQNIPYRAYENIVYVRRPADAQYESMNIYIPEAYFHGGSINGYTADTAPIFLPNQIGGYMSAKPGEPGKGGFGPKTDAPDAMQVALSQGLVVASPGARGRTQANGKAPAAIVDLKAAVRYLHYNDAVMAGDANKIISNGTSAGGALSVLLGATGGERDYEPYLNKLGAAPASDKIFAVSAYCPISILEHADAAYEWQFGDVADYHKMDISMTDYHVQRKLIKGTLNDSQKALAAELKKTFPAYLNSLNLRDENGQALSLDDQGNGSFKQYVAGYLKQSAQGALDKGENLSAYSWLDIQGKRVAGVDFDRYAAAVGRAKTPPAFDAVDLSAAENELFGDAQTDKRHFTAFSAAHNTAQNAQTADAFTVKLMNPMNYISSGTATQNWRIRVGTQDADTSLAVSAILATKLRNSGKQVDYALAWGKPHSGDYDLDDLFAWIHRISK